MFLQWDSGLLENGITYTNKNPERNNDILNWRPIRQINLLSMTDNLGNLSHNYVTSHNKRYFISIFDNVEILTLSKYKYKLSNDAFQSWCLFLIFVQSKSCRRTVPFDVTRHIRFSQVPIFKRDSNPALTSTYLLYLFIQSSYVTVLFSRSLINLHSLDTRIIPRGVKTQGSELKYHDESFENQCALTNTFWSKDLLSCHIFCILF